MSTRALAALLFALLLAAPAAAQRLPATIAPDHYDLTFAVDLDRARFEGTETIRVQVAEPTARVVLHALDIEFHDVTIGTGAVAQTAAVSMNPAEETATLTVPKPLARGPAEIHIRYTGMLNDKLRGFYLSRGRTRRYAVTQFESTDARRAFPCFDEPALKATFGITLVINRGDTAISNGKVLSDTPGPAATQHTVKFATSPKMSSYLVAMAVGDFQCLDGAQDGVPIRICATPDKKELGHLALESAQQILKFYNGYFAIKYPYGKLDVVAVPDFAAGAMENTAAIFYRETDLLADAKTASVGTRKKIASILAHEMAHQWFGDLVTMKWWDDIWLNEGFATWMANHPLAAWKPEWNVAVDEATETQTALNLDSLQSTRPIHAKVETPGEIEEAFDAIAYEKGAAVLRMIESYVGAEPFRKGINAYLQAYANGNATSENFWTAIARSTDKPVDKILTTFVNQPGIPLITATTSCAGGQTAVTLGEQRFLLDSSAVKTAPGERWQVPVCAKAAGQKVAACDVVTAATQSIKVPGGCAPWVFVNAGAQGYYRTEYAPEMLRAMAPHVESELTAPERVSLVGDEWALVRAGRHSVADYLTLASGFGSESSSGVLAMVTGRLDFMHEYLTTDATRTAFEAFTRKLFRPSFDALGLQPASGDSDERRSLRAVVLGALGGPGKDPDVIAKARAALDRALGGGPALDPTLAGEIVDIAASHGDAKLYDALMAAMTKATSPDERDRYLYALPDFRDPSLIDRALQYSLSPQLRSQDTAIYLGRFFGNPAARARAWTFVKQRWTELEPKIMISLGDVNLVGSLSAFCDAGTRDDIKAFFAAHKLPSAARTLSQTIERIDNCIALREKQAPALAEWLARR
jgi:puromycin-sensitive aminopeptidase